MLRRISFVRMRLRALQIISRGRGGSKILSRGLDGLGVYR